MQGLIQSVLQDIPEFVDASVTINDWSRSDLSGDYGPMAVITNADLFTSRQDTQTPVTTWQIRVELWVRNTPHQADSLNKLRDMRQAIVDQFNLLAGQRAGPAGESITVDVIESDGPISAAYDVYQTPSDMQQAIPVWWMQAIRLTVEEY